MFKWTLSIFFMLREKYRCFCKLSKKAARVSVDQSEAVF